jgi:hypothetical protein
MLGVVAFKSPHHRYFEIDCGDPKQMLILEKICFFVVAQLAPKDETSKRVVHSHHQWRKT